MCVYIVSCVFGNFIASVHVFNTCTSLKKAAVCIRNMWGNKTISATSWRWIYVCGAFVYSNWIWEQTAIISLFSINWLVFITETASVYRAVCTESRNVIQGNLGIAQHAPGNPATGQVDQDFSWLLSVLEQMHICFPNFTLHCNTSRAPLPNIF